MRIERILIVCLLAFGGCSSNNVIGEGSGGAPGSKFDALVVSLPDGPAPGGSDDDANGALSADGDHCGISRSNMSRLPADLLIVQDRSGTMLEDSKWEQVTTAVNEVVAETESTIRWGLKLFALPYSEDPTVRCYVPDEITVPVDYDNSRRISEALASTPPSPESSGSATPTRWAIEKALAYLQSVNDGFPKYMLLATDGLPNCKNGIMSGDDYGGKDDQAAIAAISAARDAQVPVFVVGIDIGGGGDTLNAMAEAGGKARTEAIKYYPATASTGLAEALQQIVGSIPTCTFTLGSRPPVPENIAVDAQLAGGGTVRIPKDTTHAAGWDYATAALTSIEIFGQHCDDIMSGRISAVEAIFGCPGQLIP